MLPGFNKEKLLEERADKVPDKTPEVAGELRQIVTVVKDNKKATEGSVAAKESSPNLSLNL